MKKHFIIYLFISLAFKCFSQSGDTCSGRPEDRFRVLFIVDASFSMDRKWGKEHLWDVSRKTVEDFAFFLQKNYNVEMGLRVYGHQSPLTDNDCKDSKLEVPIALNAASQISNKLKTIKYKGTTPLTYSLEQAAEDLGCNSKKNIIILITDGYETCNLNPCAVAAKLTDYRISIKPLILGLNIDYKDIEHLKCIGDFYNVKNKEEYKRDLYNSFINIANKKQFSLYLLQDSKIKSATNVPFTVFNSKNRELIATYYHHISEKGIPDTITIGNYDTIDIKIHTTPPIFLFKVPLKKYIHNTIKTDYPIGRLNIAWESTKSNIHFEDPEAMIYQNGQFLTRTPLSAQFMLKQGNYQAFLNTMPSQYFNTIKIETAQSHNIVLKSPAYLTINKSHAIYADLYLQTSNGLKAIAMLQANKMKETYTVQPGKYKIIYKSIKALTIHGTFSKEFELNSSEEKTIEL